MVTDIQTGKDIDQMLSALEEIREHAATKPNGGAWAAGIATLCLSTLASQLPRRPAGSADLYGVPRAEE